MSTTRDKYVEGARSELGQGVVHLPGWSGDSTNYVHPSGAQCGGDEEFWWTSADHMRGSATDEPRAPDSLAEAAAAALGYAVKFSEEMGCYQWSSASGELGWIEGDDQSAELAALDALRYAEAARARKMGF